MHHSIVVDQSALKEESTLSIDFENSDPDVSFFRRWKPRRSWLSLRVFMYATISFLVTSGIATLWYFTSFNPVDGIIFASRECQRTPFTKSCLSKKIVIGNPNTWLEGGEGFREPASYE